MHIHTAGEYCVAGFVEHRITSLGYFRVELTAPILRNRMFSWIFDKDVWFRVVECSRSRFVHFPVGMLSLELWNTIEGRLNIRR